MCKLITFLLISFRYLIVIRLHHHLVYQNPIQSSPSVHPITVHGLLLKEQWLSHSRYFRTTFAIPTPSQVGFLLSPAPHRRPVTGLQHRSHRASSHQVQTAQTHVSRHPWANRRSFGDMFFTKCPHSFFLKWKCKHLNCTELNDEINYRSTWNVTVFKDFSLKSKIRSFSW